MASLLNRRLHSFKVVVGMLTCCMAGFIFYGIGFSAPVSTKETAPLSTKEKQALVQQAVAYYEQGESAKAQENLERAQTDFPENYAVPYYLGLIYTDDEHIYYQGPAGWYYIQVYGYPSNTGNTYYFRWNWTIG